MYVYCQLFTQDVNGALMRNCSPADLISITDDGLWLEFNKSTNRRFVTIFEVHIFGFYTTRKVDNMKKKKSLVLFTLNKSHSDNTKTYYFF